MKKRKVLIGLILLITLSSVSLASEIKFRDIEESHWGYESIYWGVQNNVVAGYTDGTFRPDLQITEQEFATVLARFVKDTDKSKFVKKPGVHWSQPYYDELARFQIPLKGYNDKKAKETAPTRGDIARIVAAKNGFNLNERQAIYYMYENEISLGTVPGQMTFNSYGANEPTTRAHTVAFFQRLSNEGITTFKGKPSNVKGDGMGGIVGVPESNETITDKDFDDLAKDKGITNPGSGTGEVGTLENPVTGDLGDFRRELSKNKHLLGKFIGKVNGLITPVDVNNTLAHPGNNMIIKTRLSHSTRKKNGAFTDKKLFFDIIENYWGDTLDDNQIRHIRELTDKYISDGEKPISGVKSTNPYIVLGKKNDMKITGNRIFVGIEVYNKEANLSNWDIPKKK